ncbi:hypothetical protein LIER_03503 [Lithospermum erythrorhizon]|uniref:Uncharacterized protein n=1 Tax=Lithospermum erythrorhizon TaxID=34254 RepID=A0AAV3NUK0_LITER
MPRVYPPGGYNRVVPGGDSTVRDPGSGLKAVWWKFTPALSRLLYDAIARSIKEIQSFFAMTSYTITDHS